MSTYSYPHPSRSATPSRSSSSAASGIKCRVELTELYAGIGGGEAPLGRDLGAIPPPLPGRGMAREVGPASDAFRQVAGQRAELDLGQVQPGAVLGGAVDLEPVGQ